MQDRRRCRELLTAARPRRTSRSGDSPFVYPARGRRPTNMRAGNVTDRRGDGVGVIAGARGPRPRTTMKRSRRESRYEARARAASARLHRPRRVDARIGLVVASMMTSRIWAVCSGSTTSTRCTATTRAPAAIRRRTASATRSRLRSASTTTDSSVRIAPVRAISAARRS